ncbi:MAG: HEAT repeat domain-containing protein [Simkaniaceae bacterium]
MRNFFLFLIINGAAFLFSAEKSQILYLIKCKENEKAFSFYQDHFKNNHDPSFLEEMATLILRQGILHQDPEVQLLTLYGASICDHQYPLSILEEGLSASNPYVQAAAIQILAKMGENGTSEILMKALQSPYIMIRIQAAHALAARGFTPALGPIESLMRKLPYEAWTFFPELYAQMGSKKAITLLKSLMHNKAQSVRLSSVFHAAKFNRDDLLPFIRSMASHVDFAEQEMAAFALGTFHDIGSKPILKKLSKSKIPDVALSSSYALCKIGNKKALKNIIEKAEKKNLHAITLLGHLQEEQKTLLSLIHDEDRNVRLNAILALLKHKNPKVLGPLGEFLLYRENELGFGPHFSRGRSLRAFRCISLAKSKDKIEKSDLVAFSHALREEMLLDSVELEESLFLMVARKIFDYQQLNLIPLLVQLLENKNSEQSLSLLKDQSQKAGAPLIRAYCQLGLYRNQTKNHDHTLFYKWLGSEKDHYLFQFAAKGSTKKDNELNTQFALSPEDKSRLIIESYQALVEAHDPEAIFLIMNALIHGHPKNRYLLAGLLLLAIS